MRNTEAVVRRRLPPPVVVAAGYAAGALPFSNWAARVLKGTDLRGVGTGTVSGTSLYDVAGFVPLAVAGVAEVAKGSVGPLAAGDRLPLRAAAAAAAVAGHNWSPLVGFAGGRGLSPAIGALLVSAPAGAALLLAGMTGGRLAGETALGCAVAYAALVPVCRRVHGRAGGQAAGAVLAPMIAKRLAGNRRPERRALSVYGARLLLDRDTWAKHG
jgi:glycerol-3-phosphate acyltransferase PlsY